MASITEAFEAALQTPSGVALITSSLAEVKLLRKRCYNLRQRLRIQGNNKYNGLSFVIQNWELLIIKREVVPTIDQKQSYSIRELSAEDIPKKLIVRGTRRLGLLERLALDKALITE